MTTINPDHASDPVASPPAGTPVFDGSRNAAAVAVDSAHTLRTDVVEREKEEFGGFKFGAAFFGWLTATGTAVLLTAVVAAAGAAIGISQNGSADAAADAATEDAGAVGLIGAIAVAVVLFVGYFAGGYVAGRMARFSGAKQGFAVWLWAIVIAVVVAIVSSIAGNQFNILANLNSFPRAPIGEGAITTLGIITILAAVLVTLLGAVLGGRAGMRYHRKVDRVGLGR